MEKEKIKAIIEKYKRMSNQELRYGADKCAFFERAAGQIEDCLDEYMDDDYETEEDILYDVKEAFAEVDDYYDDEDLINNIF